MREHKRDKGFITIAQNNDDTDYVEMAYYLALSLRASQKEVPYLSILKTPGYTIPDNYAHVFDEIIDIPWNDDAQYEHWKIHNKWKVFHVSPYVNTILLDCDMLFTVNVDWWWNELSEKDLWWCSQPRAYKGDIINSSPYREAFEGNDLPSVYTALLYFGYNDLSLEYFKMVKFVYRNWDALRPAIFKGKAPRSISGDLSFAIAAKLMDLEKECSSYNSSISFVHMKTKLQNFEYVEDMSEDWSLHLNAYLDRYNNLMIGNYRQMYPFHYHIKNFPSENMKRELRRYE